MDVNKVNLDTCPAQIIQRVLEYGNLKDWQLILSYYGLDRIVSICQSLRTLDKKHCLIFAVFQTPLKNNTDVIISNSHSHTLELLKKLTNEEFLSKARLVGGTALALQYGHRISIDLDFFGNIEEDNETIKEVLINIGKLSVSKSLKTSRYTYLMILK